jgi:hypothetical protein
MNKLLLLGLGAVLVLPLAASAAGHRKPGLWEITTTMKYTKGGPQIPPEQLAKMQQLGIKMPSMGSGEPQVIQQCLTAEQAAKEDHPQTQAARECEMQNPSWSGNTFTGDMVCHSHGGEMHGHITSTYSGDSSFSGSSTLEGKSPAMGGDFVMEQTSSGKWLGADCGNVAPGKFQLGQ